MNTEKIKEVFADQAFVKSLLSLENADELQSALEEKGLVFSENEAHAIYDLITKVKNGEFSKEQLELWQQQAQNGELPDELLEHVSGGGFFTFLCCFIGSGFLLSMGVGIYGIIDTAIS